jgi:hypothetical protein
MSTSCNRERSKSFFITRGTHSCTVLETCCVFDSSVSRSKSFSITRGTVIENDLLLLRDELNKQHVPRKERDLAPRVIENDLLLIRDP